jgi:hypothetical protein
MSVDQLPNTASSKLIAFEQAEVIPGFVNDTWFLHVSGQAPCLNMQVELVPRIYITCPDYWAIEVVGTLHGFCLTAMKPYDLTIPLAHITGSRGIEVVGANATRQFDVTGGCS